MILDICFMPGCLDFFQILAKGVFTIKGCHLIFAQLSTPENLIISKLCDIILSLQDSYIAQDEKT